MNKPKKHRLAAMHSSESVEWNTPLSVFDPLDDQYHFDLDPCSDGTNARCGRFFTAKQDGVKQVWNANAVWLNPPYARGVTGKWMRKAYESVAKGDCKTLVALIPVRSGSKWFQEWVLGKADKVRFVEGRIHFIKNGVETEATAKPAAFDSVIVIYDGSRKLGKPIKVETCGFNARGKKTEGGREGATGRVAELLGQGSLDLQKAIKSSTPKETTMKTPFKKHGRPEVYTAERLAQIVALVKSGMTVKAAMAAFNDKTSLKFTYTPLLVASRRHGTSFRGVVKTTKAASHPQSPSQVDLGSLTPKTPYLILKGNSAQILRGIPSASVNLVLTSPPYTTDSNVPRKNKDYNAHFDFNAIAAELVRVMAAGAFLLLNEDAMVEKDGPNKGGRSLLPYLHVIKLVELGLVRHQTIIWDKGQARYPNRYRQSHAYETIEVFYKPPFDKSQITILRDRPNKCAGMSTRYNVRYVDGTLIKVKSSNVTAEFGKRTDIWHYSPGAGKSYNRSYLRKHPALMHQSLVADLIKSFVRPVQANGHPSVVLDPFGGLQTTANEALKQGMFAVGIEMSPNYCALGKRRLDETLQEIRSEDTPAVTQNIPTPEPKVTAMKSIDLSKLSAMKNKQEVLVKKEAITPTPTTETTMTIPATLKSSTSDILSLTEITDLGCQDIPVVVEGLIPAQGVCIIGGSSGSKKTWAAVDLALEASRGGIWLGYQTTKTTTYYVDGEMSQQSLGKRVREIIIGKGMSLEGANIIFKSSGAMNLKDETCLEGLKADIRRHKVGMLVIDPLVAMIANFSENSASDVAKVFKILKGLADEFNLVVVVVDHHTKAGTELRGSGAKKGYADTVLAISKTSNGKSEMVIKKNRHWGNEDQVVNFELATQGSGVRLRVVEEQVEQQFVQELRLVQDLAPMILNRLAAGQGISRKELVTEGMAQGYSLKKVDAALQQLEAARKISKQKDTQSKKRGNRAYVYRLAVSEVAYQEAA
jgi:phage N-6-adenine-methyltransferase